jgi:pantoate--beta-alanine ligase
MQIITHAAELRKVNSHPIAFVPTMGALHEGHVALFRAARKYSDHVVVSVFINPLQFDDEKDLKRYPRTPEVDIEVAESAGVSTLWLPEIDEIYPDSIVKIWPGPVGELYEGQSRTGHFTGVLTVVKRLLDLVQPQWAFFGEKDFQQLYLIRQMIRDLLLAVEIISVPTVREITGLAISSRNVRLKGIDRQMALVISRALREASLATDIVEMQKALDDTLAEEPGFTQDYAVIIDEDNFELAREKTYAKRALIAGWINGVRLIDNMLVTGERP